MISSSFKRQNQVFICKFYRKYRLPLLFMLICLVYLWLFFTEILVISHNMASFTITKRETFTSWIVQGSKRLFKQADLLFITYSDRYFKSKIFSWLLILLKNQATFVYCKLLTTVVQLQSFETEISLDFSAIYYFNAERAKWWDHETLVEGPAAKRRGQISD